MPRALIASTAVFIAAAFLVGASQDRGGAPASFIDASAFVCPMHPDYTLDIPGSCPRCGMALVRSTPYDVRDYGFEFSTTPALVRPGTPSTWRFRIFDPGSGEQVRAFETVHERQFHLFVVSHDLTHFEHLHPRLGDDGTWALDVSVPKAGYYKVMADFMPAGGTSQLIARPLVTADYVGSPLDAVPLLAPDRTATKTIGDLTATVSYDPPTPTAGLYAHLIFDLRDTATGRPVTDLQTYLGAFGHTLLVSEDLTEYVHAHPLDVLNPGDEDEAPQFVIPPGADLEALRGGPRVIFDGLMPKPGRYRAWTQFRRGDRLHTFTSTFEVVPPPGSERRR